MIFHLLKKGPCREKKADLRERKLPLHLSRHRPAPGWSRFVARWASSVLLFTNGEKSMVAWGLQSSGNLNSWRRRTANSSASLLTWAWRKPCCRTSCQKSFKAFTQAWASHRLDGEVWCQHAEGSCCDHAQPGCVFVQIQCTRQLCFGHANERDYADSRSLRLQASSCNAQTWRL